MTTVPYRKVQRKKASYHRGILWIAENDEPTIMDIEAMQGFASVHALAAAFDKDSYRVTADVIALREKRA